MNYRVKCLKCGATWWQRGSFEPDTNATVLNDNELPDEMCQCGDQTEVFDQEPIDFDDNYM